MTDNQRALSVLVRTYLKQKWNPKAAEKLASDELESIKLAVRAVYPHLSRTQRAAKVLKRAEWNANQ